MRERKEEPTRRSTRLRAPGFGSVSSAKSNTPKEPIVIDEDEEDSSIFTPLQICYSKEQSEIETEIEENEAFSKGRIWMELNMMMTLMQVMLRETYPLTYLRIA